MDGVMHHLMHEVGAAPLYLLVVTSIVYSAFLAKFLSLNFIKGPEPKHVHLHGEILMPIGYGVMVSMLAVLLYEILGKTEPIAATFVEKGFEKASMMVGLAVLASYLIAVAVPRLESPIGRFLGDRMYMPALNDLIMPKIGWAIAWLVDKGNRLIDFFCHRAIPDLIATYSLGIRSVQTGYLGRYVKIVLGFVMAALIVAAVVGW